MWCQDCSSRVLYPQSDDHGVVVTVDRAEPSLMLWIWRLALFSPVGSCWEAWPSFSRPLPLTCITRQWCFVMAAVLRFDVSHPPWPTVRTVIGVRRNRRGQVAQWAPSPAAAWEKACPASHPRCRYRVQEAWEQETRAEARARARRRFRSRPGRGWHVVLLDLFVGPRRNGPA